MCSRHGSDQTAWLGLDAHSAVKMCRACRQEGREEIDGMFTRRKELIQQALRKLAIAEVVSKERRDPHA